MNEDKCDAIELWCRNKFVVCAQHRVGHDKKEFIIVLLTEAKMAANNIDFNIVYRITKERVGARKSFKRLGEGCQRKSSP